MHDAVILQDADIENNAEHHCAWPISRSTTIVRYESDAQEVFIADIDIKINAEDQAHHYLFFRL